MAKGYVVPEKSMFGVPSTWSAPVSDGVHATRTFVDDVDPASREPAEGEEYERQRWLHGHLAEG